MLSPAVVLLLVQFVPAISITKLSLQIEPPYANELISDEVNIGCAVDNSTTGVVSIYVGKENGSCAIGAVNATNVNTGACFEPRMLVEGSIANNKSNQKTSYISIKIWNPVIRDSGVYVCRVVYGTCPTQKVMVRARLKVDRSQERARSMYILKSLSFLEKKVSELEHKLRRKKGQPEKNKQTTLSNAPAFSAYIGMSGGQILKKGGTIIFPNLTTNIGGFYNHHNGIFTAPLKGVYVFSVTLATTAAGLKIESLLLANDRRLITLIAHSKADKDQASGTVVVSLKAGDLVKNIFRRTYHRWALDIQSGLSMFSGFLLSLL